MDTPRTPTFTDRALRAFPLLGVGFAYPHLRGALSEAKASDRRYAEAMASLGAKANFERASERRTLAEAAGRTAGNLAACAGVAAAWHVGRLPAEATAPLAWCASLVLDAVLGRASLALHDALADAKYRRLHR